MLLSADTWRSRPVTRGYQTRSLVHYRLSPGCLLRINVWHDETVYVLHEYLLGPDDRSNLRYSTTSCLALSLCDALGNGHFRTRIGYASHKLGLNGHDYCICLVGSTRSSVNDLLQQACLPRMVWILKAWSACHGYDLRRVVVLRNSHHSLRHPWNSTTGGYGDHLLSR